MNPLRRQTEGLHTQAIVTRTSESRRRVYLVLFGSAKIKSERRFIYLALFD